MHSETIWLPTTGKRTIVATEDRLCKGDLADIDFIPTAVDFLQQGIGRMTIDR